MNRAVGDRDPAAETSSHGHYDVDDTAEQAVSKTLE